MVKVLLSGNTHIMGFNTPRKSQHDLIRSQQIVKLMRTWRPFEGLALWRPIKQDYDLVHSFNSIPYTKKPFIVTTESFLPRTVGIGGDLLKTILRERLVKNNCRKIIAMSEYAVLKLSRQNHDWSALNEILKKVEIIHPNVPVKACTPKTYNKNEPLQVVFVGGHFARKGGIVALRLASMAKQIGLPIIVHIASRLDYGTNVYMDYADGAKYARDIELLELDNVVYHKHLPNHEVINLLTKSHIQLLATLDDTYGFSLIEGFSVATPAITTNVCALPEFVRNGENGLLLNLELNESRNWIHRYFDEYRDWVYKARCHQEQYWNILDVTYSQLAEQALQLLVDIIDNPHKYDYLSAGALSSAMTLHNADKTSQVLDDIYLQAVS